MSNGNFSIRRATEADIPRIIDLLEQVLSVHHCGRPDIFKTSGQKYSSEQLKVIIANDDNPVFVCEDMSGKVIGHCFCQTIDRPETPAAYPYKTLYIDDLCVDASERGHHVGSALYKHAKAYALANGYFNVTLHAWSCNPDAVAFYKNLGMSIQQYTMEETLR